MDPVPHVIPSLAIICPYCETAHPLLHDYTVPQTVHIVCHGCEKVVRRFITQHDIDMRDEKRRRARG